jgi:hypothetical protein
VAGSATLRRVTDCVGSCLAQARGDGIAHPPKRWAPVASTDCGEDAPCEVDVNGLVKRHGRSSGRGQGQRWDERYRVAVANEREEDGHVVRSVTDVGLEPGGSRSAKESLRVGGVRMTRCPSTIGQGGKLKWSPLMGQGIGQRERDEHRFVSLEASRDAWMYRPGGLLVLLPDDKIDTTARKERKRCLGLELEDLDAKVRVGLQRRQCERDCDACGGLEGRHADRAADPALERLDVRSGALELLEDRLAVLGELAAGLGELQLPPVTLDELHSHLRLQLRELLRDSGGAVLERVRDRREGALVAELAQQVEATEIQLVSFA